MENGGSTRSLEDFYLMGSVITRGQFSDIVTCLYKGKTERACRVYQKINLKLDKIKQLNKILSIIHPNLVKVHEVFETETELRLICELVKGPELFERIIEIGHYSEKEAAQAISSVLSALQYLHKEGIVHGDIRPESLIYQSERSDAPLKLRDVSLSPVSYTSCTTIYIAPEKEKLHGDRKEEDIWSLGIVMYIMLCGIEPCKCTANLSVCGFYLPLWEEISENARVLLKRMLDEEPSTRITASEAFEDSWTRGHSTCLDHMPTTIHRLKEFNARNKFRAATKAVLATHRLIISPQRKKEMR